MTNEVWKDVKGFAGRYQVSNMGRVKSLARQAGTVFRKERMLNADNRLTQDGYRRVNLYDGTRGHDKRVARLVAEHFIDNPDNKPTINHLNGIKTDDRVKNLEWSTLAENMQHAYDNNLKKPMKGNTNPNSKLTSEEVKEIRSRYKRYCRENGTVSLAKEFGVTHRVINLIVRNKSYRNIH